MIGGHESVGGGGKKNPLGYLICIPTTTKLETVILLTKEDPKIYKSQEIPLEFYNFHYIGKKDKNCTILYIL